MTTIKLGDKIELTVIVDHYEDAHDDPVVLCRTDGLPGYSFVIPAWVLSTGRVLPPTNDGSE